MVIAESTVHAGPTAMPKRRLGSMPWEASLLTLGGVKWDTKLNDSQAVALVHRAFELGVNTFDTAHAYGGGESERKLGLGLQGLREHVWVNTKTMDRTYDGAMREVETSLKRLRMEHVDLLFVHSVDSEEHYSQIMAPNSVLKAVEELRADGRIRYVGVSGHWVRNVLARLLAEVAFDAVLCPGGLFNIAYNYSFVDTVLPVARGRNMAVLVMKALAAGRAAHAHSVEPYLRYSYTLPCDTAVIGADSISQLEQLVRTACSNPQPLSRAEMDALAPEAVRITQEWGPGEFDWLQEYPEYRRMKDGLPAAQL